MKRQTAIKKTLELYDQDRKRVEELAEKAVSCGAVDLDDYPEAEYALPKIILSVIYQTLRDGWEPLNKEHKDEAANLYSSI